MRRGEEKTDSRWDRVGSRQGRTDALLLFMGLYRIKLCGEFGGTPSQMAHGPSQVGVLVGVLQRNRTNQICVHVIHTISMSVKDRFTIRHCLMR